MKLQSFRRTLPLTIDPPSHKGPQTPPLPLVTSHLLPKPLIYYLSLSASTTHPLIGDFSLS